MTFFNANLKRGLVAMLAVSLISYTFLQHDKIRIQAEKLLRLENHVSFLETSLASETETSNRLREENRALDQKISILKDSITQLNKDVVGLKLALQHANTTLSNIQEELSRKNTEIATLNASIFQMKKEKADASSIADAEALLAAKKENVIQLKVMKVDEEEKQEKTEEQLVLQELEAKRLSQVEKVMTQTQVIYDEIECKSRRSSRSLRKMDEDGSNWVFTSFSFQVVNPDQSLIFEEYFRLKIVDADTGEEMAFTESNNGMDAVVASGTPGFSFQWRSNPTEALYINMQAKTGRNYDAKLYYVNNEREYLIKNSVTPIVRNGKMVK